VTNPVTPTSPATSIDVRQGQTPVVVPGPQLMPGACGSSSPTGSGIHSDRQPSGEGPGHSGAGVPPIIPLSNDGPGLTGAHSDHLGNERPWSLVGSGAWRKTSLKKSPEPGQLPGARPTSKAQSSKQLPPYD